MSKHNVPPEETMVRAEELITYKDLQRLVTTWKNSNRVKIEIAGQSHEQRYLYSVIVSSPENIETLSLLQQQGKRLTTPVVSHRTLNDVDVHFECPIPNNPVTTVLIEGGGFGMEAAHVEALVSLIEHLVSSEDAEVQRILARNIVVVMPMVNPDGRMLAIEEWKKTPLSAGMSGNGNKYGFTLNRDLFNLTQSESKAIMAASRDWGLIAVCDAHEDMALLGVSHEEVCWSPALQ